MATQNKKSDTEGGLPELLQWNSSWITSRIDADAILYADRLGLHLAKKKFTSSQFRNFYGELKRIQLRGISELKSAFHLLKPKLAYATARAEKKGQEGSKLFKTHIIQAHEAVDIDNEGSEIRFANFCDIVEAILAFHKAHGGRD